MSNSIGINPYSALNTSTLSGAAGTHSSLQPQDDETKNNEEINAVAKDFESVFLTQMMKHMFAGEEANAYFGEGTAGDIYKDFLMNEYGKSIANAGGIGIADVVRQELLKMQEVSA
jgi:peptidoglycan hydrolase FlgJ